MTDAVENLSYVNCKNLKLVYGMLCEPIDWYMLAHYSVFSVAHCTGLCYGTSECGTDAGQAH